MCALVCIVKNKKSPILNASLKLINPFIKLMEDKERFELAIKNNQSLATLKDI